MGKKLNIRFSDNQMLVLTQLKEKLNAPISVIVRSMILNFLTQYEDVLDRILSGETIIDTKDIFDDDEE